MNEYVVPPVIGNDEAIPLDRIKPFDDAADLERRIDGSRRSFQTFFHPHHDFKPAAGRSVAACPVRRSFSPVRGFPPHDPPRIIWKYNSLFFPLKARAAATARLNALPEGGNAYN